MNRVPYILSFLLLSLSIVSCSTSGQDEKDGHGHGHDHKHGGEMSEVELTQAQINAVGIQLGTMEKRNMANSIPASGTLMVTPQNEAVVTSRLSGIISNICVVEGQKVSAGQVVAYVDAPEIISLRQEYAIAKQELESASTEYKRQQALSAQGAGIKKNLDSARSLLNLAEIKLQSCKDRMESYGVSPEGHSSSVSVKSPIAGIVVSLSGTIGSFADMQLPIATIVNNDAIYCQLRLLEKDMGTVRPGMEVNMQLTNDPAQTFRGRIQEITPSIDPALRSVPVRVSIEGNKTGLTLTPGMAVTAQISGEGEESDVLPEEAVVSASGKSYIFVLEDTHTENGSKNYHFEKIEVIKDITYMGYIAVTPLQPLSPDAQIVTKGAFYLNSMSSDHGEHNH